MYYSSLPHQIDFITTIVQMLPGIEVNDVRFHLLRPDYEQIIVTGKPFFIDETPSQKTQELAKKQMYWTYHNKIKE
jgi:hypothetical protein